MFEGTEPHIKQSFSYMISNLKAFISKNFPKYKSIKKNLIIATLTREAK